MSEEFGERTFRLNLRVLLPSVLALALFVVLVGLVAAVVVGLSTDPSDAPEIAEMAPTAPEPAVPAVPAAPAEPAAVAPSAAELVPGEPAPEESVPAAPQPAAHAAGSQSDEPSVTPAAPPAPAPESVPGPVTAPVTEPAPETAAAAPPETAAPQQVVSAPPPPPVPQLPRTSPNRGGLRPAPDPALVEQSSFGPLPRIGANGREPWQAYARPTASGDDRPRVAIILSGLGLSSAATEAAIQGLPGEVTLAFQPFADNIQQWIRLARAAGHEVLLNLPMEPVDFPANDPGPRALFVTLSPDENEDRLRWALSRVTGYVGVLNHMGSRFTTSRESMQPILAEIKARGLLYVDARSSARSVATVMASQMQVPRAINDRFLDSREVSRVTIDARLTEIERIAKDAGVSIAIGQGFPVTIERVREWAQTLDSKGLALVPVSAVVNTQADR